jgi:CheY-like chemotaxis protein
MEYRVRGYAGPRQTVLVVDDNEVQRDLVHDMLAPLGFAVVSAASGKECLQLAEQTNPNLILLDIAMPEMDGWEVAQRLRRQPGKRGAILMLSANAIDPHHMLEAERLYDDTLMKPIDLHQLLKQIHALLDIEWIYETDTPASSLPTPLSASMPPSGRDIDELIQLGDIGHVRQILEKLNEIESSSPECRDFTVRMRSMVTAFDFKRYVSALKEVRGAHA